MTINLLGGLRVLREGMAVTAWPSRRAAELVALLALAEGRQLPRDVVVDQLWPHLDACAGASNLRKAAHHARRALGDPEAVVLRAGTVALFPRLRVTTDVEDFLRSAAAALRSGDPAACRRAAEGCAGELLPEEPYEAWAQHPRWEVRSRLAQLLRCAGCWDRLIELEPTEESAYRELIRAELGAGRRRSALHVYERLRLALARELGTRPSAETQALLRLA